MRIIFEKGDLVEHINVESCALVVQSITTSGVVVTLLEPSKSRINCFGEDILSGKLLPFEDLRLSNSTYNNAVVVVGNEEVELHERFENKFKRLMQDHELLNKKPSWDDAPDYAKSLGVCDIEGDLSYGEWCWCSGINPEKFTHVEQRQ